MSAVEITVALDGADELGKTLAAISSGLRVRGPLHARMAKDAGDLTRGYLQGQNEHKTADRLGATPTGFRARAATLVQEDSNEDFAVVRMPRSTGLGRAFGNVILTPGTGRKYLTIPGHKDTYGKVVRDFGNEEFAFAMIDGKSGPFPALVFREDGGAHKKGEIGYFLRRSVTQKQDRGLLPADEDYQDIGRGAAVAYLTELISNTQMA